MAKNLKLKIERYEANIKLSCSCKAKLYYFQILSLKMFEKISNELILLHQPILVIHITSVFKSKTMSMYNETIEVH